MLSHALAAGAAGGFPSSLKKNSWRWGSQKLIDGTRRRETESGRTGKSHVFTMKTTCPSDSLGANRKGQRIKEDQLRLLSKMRNSCSFAL